VAWANKDLDTGSSIGFKSDKGKPRMELLPVVPLEMAAEVFTYGHEKYSDISSTYANNWLQGMDWGRVYGALQRHLSAYWNGEDIDEESGMSHLAHALSCLMMLAEYQAKPALYSKFDDRPTVTHVAQWGTILEASKTNEH